MRLSWRDLLTTLVAITVGVGLVAGILNYDWSFFGTWKGGVGTMAALGTLFLIFDEVDFERLNAWSLVEWVLALTGFGLVIAGLIVASKVLFVVLAADILALWFASLVRHAFSHEQAKEHLTFPSV